MYSSLGSPVLLYVFCTYCFSIYVQGAAALYRPCVWSSISHNTGNYINKGAHGRIFENVYHLQIAMNFSPSFSLSKTEFLFQHVQYGMQQYTGCVRLSFDPIKTTERGGEGDEARVNHPCEDGRGYQASPNQHGHVQYYSSISPARPRGVTGTSWQMSVCTVHSVWWLECCKMPWYAPKPRSDTCSALVAVPVRQCTFSFVLPSMRTQPMSHALRWLHPTSRCQCETSHNRL